MDRFREPAGPIEWHDRPDFLFRPEEIPPRPARVARGVFGNARLARREDIADLIGGGEPEAGALRFPGATLLVESSADGSRLAPVIGRDLALPASVRERHVLAVGTTGGGKTTRLLLPALASDLADPGRAVIALDGKGGALYPFAAALGARFRPGRPVRRLNLKAREIGASAWNPLARPLGRRLALETAHAVCVNVDSGTHPGGTNEAFWLFSSVNLLSDILLALADDPGEDLSLARARAIVDLETYGLAVFADKHPTSDKFNARYPAIVRVLEGSSHQTQPCVIADLAMRLGLLGDEDVARNTSGTGGIDLAAVLLEGDALVIDTPEAHARQLLPLTNLLVGRVLSEIIRIATDRPDGRLPRPCTLLLDEFGSACGRLPEFETRLATLRSRGVTVIAAVQTVSQIEQVYGKAAESILENFSTKVFLGGSVSLADAQRASLMSGQCTAMTPSVTVTRGPGEGLAGLRSRTRTAVARPVLLADEVARPPVNALLGPPAIAFAPGRPPFYAYLPPIYEMPIWRLLGEAGRPPDPP